MARQAPEGDAPVGATEEGGGLGGRRDDEVDPQYEAFYITVIAGKATFHTRAGSVTKDPKLLRTDVQGVESARYWLLGSVQHMQKYSDEWKVGHRPRACAGVETDAKCPACLVRTWALVLYLQSLHPDEVRYAGKTTGGGRLPREVSET